jgi:hypothetical protein
MGSLPLSCGCATIADMYYFVSFRAANIRALQQKTSLRFQVLNFE